MYGNRPCDDSSYDLGGSKSGSGRMQRFCEALQITVYQKKCGMRVVSSEL